MNNESADSKLTALIADVDAQLVRTNNFVMAFAGACILALAIQFCSVL